MRGKHTVEKIGGTSMSRFGEAMQNMIIGKRDKSEMYNRIFVVSAYGGITNMLLEHKNQAQTEFTHICSWRQQMGKRSG